MTLCDIATFATFRLKAGVLSQVSRLSQGVPLKSEK